MIQVFGKPIVYKFNPSIKGESISVDSLISARIFSTIPTNDQIQTPATAGFVSEKTTWDDKGEYKEITFLPLVDSTPFGTDLYEKFYVVVNFKYDASGQTVFVTETIFVHRPDSVASRVSVDPLSIFELETSLKQFYELQDLNKFIEHAVKLTFRKYKGRGYELNRMFNLEELNDAVLYKAVELACWSRFTTDTPHWKEKAVIYQDLFNVIFEATKPGYDITGTDDPSLEETVSTGEVWLER